MKTTAVKLVAALTGLLCVLGLVPSAVGQQPSSSGTSSCQESLPDLYTRVSPAIVLIRATSIDPYDPDHRIQRVEGSGVIIDPAGLILTNSHVVFGRTVIMVTLNDGTTLPASPVGADPLFDVALIRIPTPTSGTLPSGHLGDSAQVNVGDEVYAIGNPLGLSQTLTRGIVSAVNRLLPGTAWSLKEPLIQTDAAINPGNSGGPLIDRCGNIVAITTAIMPEAQGLGFAIPASLIARVIPPLMSQGRLIRPWLGLQGQLVPASLKELLRIPLTDGFLVEAVEPGSPAEKAGVRDGEFELTIAGDPILLGGDIITEVDGAKLKDADTLGQMMASLRIGTTVRLTVFREGEHTHLDVPVVERPVLPWDLPNGHTDSTVVGSRDKETAAPRGNGTARAARVAF